jgi:membrane-bound serine protease (ClpP class)
MRSAKTIGLVLLLAALAVCFAPAVVHGQSAGSSYYVITLNADIDPGTSNFVVSSLANAQSDGANHFVLVLNTFGGDSQSMDNIVQAISNFQADGGTFITLIAPPGSHAFSAGSYIAEASNEIYMANGTVIGSATPIVSGIPTGEENTTMTKDIDGFTAYMQALTSNYHRNSTATGLMVSNGVSYVASEALKLDVISGVVNSTSVDGALGEIGVPAGTTVQTEGLSSMAISVLSDPNLSSVLFLVGVLAIMIDLFHPTIILSAAGSVAIVLALLGLSYFGAPLTAVLLMIIGAAFIFLEVKTSHGISAACGVVIFAIGFLLIYQAPVPPATISPGTAPPGNFVSPNPATYAILILLSCAIVLGSIYLYRIRRDLQKRNKGRFDMKNFIGKEGFLTSDLRAGQMATANIDSEDWTVTGSQDLPKGARVKVKETDGLHLIVVGV